MILLKSNLPQMGVELLLLQLFVSQVEGAVQVLRDVFVELLKLIIQPEILVLLELLLDEEWQELLYKMRNEVSILTVAITDTEKVEPQMVHHIGY